jgi:transcriptional regulator with XRE-family HTH domain
MKTKTKCCKVEDPEMDALAERFLYYLDYAYFGSQSIMANHLGCSQAAISSIRHGRSRPGHKTLPKLANQPFVNPTWLMTGRGNPLLLDPPEETLLESLPKRSRKQLAKILMEKGLLDTQEKGKAKKDKDVPIVSVN